MNVPSTRSCGRLGLLSLALLLTSCALPREEAWRIIRQDGLIPYLAIEMGHRDPPRGTMVARTRFDPAPVNRYWQTTPVRTPLGTPPASIALRSTTSPSPVLITRSPGGSARSTTKVESRPKPMSSAPNSVATAPLPPAKPVAKSAAEAVGAVKPAPAASTSPGASVAESTKPKAAPAPEAPKPVAEAPPAPKKTETPAPQVAQKPPANAKPTAVETPYGVPVAGRPGLVNSPYAGKLQLVDVTGLKPGQEVKCPYSGKLFRVPPGATAEAKPASEAPSKKQ